MIGSSADKLTGFYGWVYILGFLFMFSTLMSVGARGSLVVKALWYKSEGRGFETREGEWDSFNLPNPSGGTRP
jgi:hypothetical protein